MTEDDDDASLLIDEYRKWRLSEMNDDSDLTEIEIRSLLAFAPTARFLLHPTDYELPA